MLATLDIPELEPVPRDHVLTKTFYLLDSFPGRYATGQTWVEALPPSDEGESAARPGPATASRRSSSPRTTSPPPGRSGRAASRSTRSSAAIRASARWPIRGGVNLVMYALTGNYKADQVHVPALLERLGQ